MIPAAAALLYPALEWCSIVPPAPVCSLAWLLRTLLQLLLLHCLLGGLISAPLLLFRRTRPAAAKLARFAAVFIPAMAAGIVLSFEVRTAVFAQIARRAGPLIQAIKAYEVKTGRPPDSLEDLVPDYLPETPTPGAGAHPEFHYIHGKTAEERYDGNPWILTFPASTGLLSFDSFLYFPLGNYPEEGYGGWLKRIGDWAYVHE